MTKINKIYVLCPELHQTGGTELAHQFVHEADILGEDCSIVYYCGNDLVNRDVPESFKKYNVNPVSSIEDSPESLVVIPEVALYFSKKFSHARFVFWWMSFDNYFNISPISSYLKFYLKGLFTIGSLLKYLYSYRRHMHVTFEDMHVLKNRVLHATQSAYAGDSLYKLGFYNQIRLTDYINFEYRSKTENHMQRRDIILYNPAKGFEVTKKIMKSLPDCEFLPLKNMTRSEIISHFSKAKLYIDFGNHPGKDRFPREAVVNGCCIVVGNRGSARYFEDIPISNEYKFSDRNLSGIKNKIMDILNNYENHVLNFKSYRSSILNERERFIGELNKLIDACRYY